MKTQWLGLRHHELLGLVCDFATCHVSLGVRRKCCRFPGDVSSYCACSYLLPPPQGPDRRGGYNHCTDGGTGVARRTRQKTQPAPHHTAPPPQKTTKEHQKHIAPRHLPLPCNLLQAPSERRRNAFVLSRLHGANGARRWQAEIMAFVGNLQASCMHPHPRLKSQELVQRSWAVFASGRADAETKKVPLLPPGARAACFGAKTGLQIPRYAQSAYSKVHTNRLRSSKPSWGVPGASVLKFTARREPKGSRDVAEKLSGPRLAENPTWLAPKGSREAPRSLT
jgi:hypothetical protein